MKATIDVPDALYRRVKARSALDGRTVRDVTVELYERWLAEIGSETAIDEGDRPAAGAAWIKRWEALGDRVAAKPADPRSAREILTADRR